MTEYLAKPGDDNWSIVMLLIDISSTDSMCETSVLCWRIREPVPHLQLSTLVSTSMPSKQRRTWRRLKFSCPVQYCWLTVTTSVSVYYKEYTS